MEKAEINIGKAVWAQGMNAQRFKALIADELNTKTTPTSGEDKD